MWWITPSQYLGYLMVLCDSLHMDVSFLKQTALVNVSGVLKDSVTMTWDLKLVLSALWCWGIAYRACVC